MHLQPIKDFSTKQNIQFKGLFNRSIPKANSIAMHHFESVSLHIANILSQDSQEFFKFIKKINPKQRAFMEVCAEIYNKNNYYSKTAENPSIIIDMVKALKNPHREHFSFVKSTNTSFENISKAFSLANNSPKSLKILKQIFKDLAPEQVVSEKTPRPFELLKSVHAKEYLKNYEKYRSYLILNKGKENFVQDLDKMFETKTFDKEIYNKKLLVENLFKKRELPNMKVFNKDFIEKNYSEEGNKVLSKCLNVIYFDTKDISLTDKTLANIYKTTTKENSEIRQELLERFRDNCFSTKFTSKSVDTLKNVDALFSKIDNDKNAEKFIKKVIKNNINISSIKELNEIMEKNNSERLNIYFNNLKNICVQVEGETRQSVIDKNLRNASFETQHARGNRLYAERYGFIKKQTSFDRIKKSIENTINIVREKLAVRHNNLENIPKAVSEPIKPAVKVSIVKTVPKAPNAKKLSIMNDVDELISKKLGKKTASVQKREYEIKATKMRLNMLPEIFNSIKETRATNRAEGKIKNMSTNKDALVLYEMINGKNRKLIKFMLKNRNANGTRNYEVKDIISVVDKANTKLLSEVRGMDRSSKSKYAKEFYQNLYTEYLNKSSKSKTLTMPVPMSQIQEAKRLVGLT